MFDLLPDLVTSLLSDLLLVLALAAWLALWLLRETGHLGVQRGDGLRRASHRRIPPSTPSGAQAPPLPGVRTGSRAHDLLDREECDARSSRDATHTATHAATRSGGARR
jgi:hypothetical protein